MATRLTRAFDFTNDDLAENQQGRLSDKQRKRLRERMIVWSLASGFFLIIFSVLLIGVIRNADDLLGYIVAALIALFVLIFATGLWTTIHDTRSDLRQGIVASVTGVAEPFSRRGYRGRPFHHLKIGTLEFDISPRYPAFRANTRYQIFYSPVTKIILSAVRLDD